MTSHQSHHFRYFRHAHVALCPNLTYVSGRCSVDSASIRTFSQLATDSCASTARGGVASTSGRHAEGVWEGWSHLRQHSQPRIHAIQERLGAAVANSVWCSPAGQVSCMQCLGVSPCLAVNMFTCTNDSLHACKAPHKWDVSVYMHAMDAFRLLNANLFSVQKVLQLWPTLLVGNALSIQQSLCLSQPTTNPPYIQQATSTEDGTLASFYAGIQEEFATILR